MNRYDLPAEAPNQYRVGEQCSECRKPLSRYNPYRVCGPCRVKASAAIAAKDVEAEMAEAERTGSHSFAWERFPKRTAVRRGPLMMETGPSQEKVA